MMASVDGRIDCTMTSKIQGVKEYYDILNAIDIPTTVSGKTTAKMELTEEPEFACDKGDAVGKDVFYKAEQAEGYSVVVDTKGTLGWKSSIVEEKPLIVIMSQLAGLKYLEYLKSKGISYIVTGEERIDLARASEILNQEFGVKRMGIVGGGTINAAFLDAGLLDEVSVLIGPAIDGRDGMKAVFDGLGAAKEPFQLKLNSAEKYDDGAVWLRYTL